MRTQSTRHATVEPKFAGPGSHIQSVKVAVRPSPLCDEPVAANRQAANQSLFQLLGLDVRAASLTLIVDTLVFGSDALSIGLMIPVGIAAAAVLGVIVYRIQRKEYGDDHDSALIKAVAIGLLTAIPIPISPLLAIPAGTLGLIRRLRRK